MRTLDTTSATPYRCTDRYSEANGPDLGAGEHHCSKLARADLGSRGRPFSTCRRPGGLWIPAALALETAFLLPGCSRPTHLVPGNTGPSAQQTKRDASLPFSTREGRAITVHPIGQVFDIPTDWVRADARGANNLHLSREDLDQFANDVERLKWDRDCELVCDAALPFSRCACHVGNQGLTDSRLDGDLQLELRVYWVLNVAKNLGRRIAEAAPRAVRVDQVRRDSTGMWERILVTFSRSRYDYSYTANVDFRMCSCDSGAIVFVFIYLDPFAASDAIPEILGSLRPGCR